MIRGSATTISQTAMGSVVNIMVASNNFQFFKSSYIEPLTFACLIFAMSLEKESIWSLAVHIMVSN